MNGNPAEWKRKYDTDANHYSILVRGGQYIISIFQHETTFPLPQIRQAMRDSVTVMEACVAPPGQRCQEACNGYVLRSNERTDCIAKTQRAFRRPP